MGDEKEILLQVNNLSVEFQTARGPLTAVNGISLSLRRGEVLGLVGESGCGKSVTALSILGLLSRSGNVTHGEVLFKRQNLLEFNQEKLRQVRGKHIAMIFQDPDSALNPVRTIGRQFMETLRRRLSFQSRPAYHRAVEALSYMKLADPEKIMKRYPFQLSGGMKQRVMIAMALAMHPEILIADEPTMALDVTIQAQILMEIHSLKEKIGTGILLISHNMGVIAQLADRVAVMYAGTIVEHGTTDSVFLNPAHPYTRALLRSIPELDNHSHSLSSIQGGPPKFPDSMTGCLFSPRCGRTTNICRATRPFLKSLRNGQRVACFFPEEETLVREKKDRKGSHVSP